MTPGRDEVAARPDELKLAYLIITHGMPDHLGRQIAALTDERTEFVVHVDRKVAIAPFLAHARPNVEFLEDRLPVYWSQWQMVEATLRLMRRALERTPDVGYLILLSGSCYPIRSRAEIRELLAAHRGDQFINIVQMPNPGVGKSLARIQRFHARSDLSRVENVRRFLSGFSLRGRSGRIASRRWLLGRDWRRGLRGLAPYGGSSWWALTADACREILAFVEREPAVVRFFEHTKYPDEGLFHTILGNAPTAPRFRRSMLFADWSRGGSHPGFITEAHVRRFAEPGPMLADGPYGKGEYCFARKIPDDGGVIAGSIDAMIRAREAGAAAEGTALRLPA
jgi:hypothetical protein